MTRRPLLWIVACAVALGVAAGSPVPVRAQIGPIGWTVTIDPYGGAVATRDVVVSGAARTPLGTTASSVDVELVPRFPECGTSPLRSTVTPSAGRYRAVVATRCNGPYEIRVVAREDGLDTTSGAPKTRDVGVAAAPGAPAPPTVVSSGGTVTATWDPVADPDAAGWILVADGTDLPAVGPGATGTELPARYGRTTFRIKALRWGAAGPNKDAVASAPSAESATITRDPQPPGAPPIDPPRSPPSSPGPGPGGGGATPPPAGTSPPASTTSRVPTRGTGSDTPLPEGYSEDLPYGVPDDAFIPGDDGPSDTASDEGEESAAGTSGPAGLVRTTEKRSPGLVAPFALGLLMITIAAHIAWYLRRSKPTAVGGQVSLP